MDEPARCRGRHSTREAPDRMLEPGSGHARTNLALTAARPRTRRTHEFSAPDGTRSWVRFACMICYEMRVFREFLGILTSRRFPRKSMMDNNLDRNCPDLASPARSWRNSIANKGFAVFLPIELMLSKGGSSLLRFATCRLRFLLRISYVSATFPATFCYVSAIKRPGHPLSGIRE